MITSPSFRAGPCAIAVVGTTRIPTRLSLPSPPPPSEEREGLCHSGNSAARLPEPDAAKSYLRRLDCLRHRNLAPTTTHLIISWVSRSTSIWSSWIADLSGIVSNLLQQRKAMSGIDSKPSPLGIHLRLPVDDRRGHAGEKTSVPLRDAAVPLRATMPAAVVAITHR
eukprot:GHVU01227554.1.p1 GENE.GHVU01227554.1~~GHVU01227554.1.p1  ORF type:complete len:167 (+),score=9.12 GHVU01227554.1:1262-1762(+)